ncbi:MAG: putative undecaprenyl-phosphate N-acetylglucosaminyl 1-phosphate transferase [Calditrichaeota bacterium]|nr:putative undecaprenyl-phosphate N-acetylglucosaminyl 1-phosphate transferase [Calditrichota bacterium]
MASGTVTGYLVALAAGAVVAAWTVWFAGRVRRWALDEELLDVPNERSGHLVAVPRVGGLSIVVTVLAGLLALGLALPLEIPWFWMLYVSGTLIIGAGLLDDLVNVRASVRLLVHVLAALVIVIWIGSELTIIFPRALNITGPVAFAGILLFIVWNVNAYNFMDGIDGLAAAQAVVVGLVAGAIAWFNGNPPLALTYTLIAAASAGFLRWNWMPAKIFMGDLCSGFLGATFAVLALWGKLTETVPFTTFLILMAVFYTDPAVTVLRRLFSGKNIFAPHREFAFHHAVRAGHSHGSVATVILLIELLYLAPLAVAATLLASNWSLLTLAAAYAPTIALALYWRAGAELEPRSVSRPGRSR